MRKEADSIKKGMSIRSKEVKICLPFYKMAYSVFFVAILSVIRGVEFTYEIGIALEPPMAVLAAVFCADTYVQEIISKRSEVERLCPMKNRMISLLYRMMIQEMFLCILAAAGYGMFELIQKPFSIYGENEGVEWRMFFLYLAAIAVTLNFWGMLSNTLSCLFRNMWAGVGGCLLIWITTDSTVGERLLGKWNLFSYTFRNVEESGDLSWICGKWICVVLILFMAAALPTIIKKRG